MIYDDPHKRHEIITGKALPDDAELYVLERLTSYGGRDTKSLDLYIRTDFPHGNAEMWGMEKAVKPILKRLVQQYKRKHEMWFWQRVPTQVIFRSNADDLEGVVARGDGRKLKLK